jgi:hypothetical protein
MANCQDIDLTPLMVLVNATTSFPQSGWSPILGFSVELGISEMTGTHL